MLSLLNARGAAETLHASEQFVRRLVLERRIPFLKIGRLVRFHPDDLAAFCVSCRVEPEESIDERRPCG